MDLFEYVIHQEQNGIDALLSSQVEKIKWIMGGSYLRIDYKDHDGKIVDTHPHIETLIKRLAQSGLSINCQQQILNDCEDNAAIKYLESLRQNDKLENLVYMGLENDESFKF